MMNAKTKKILTGAGALALTAAISITGTVAYLTHITEQRANNFTFATEGLDAMLTEPKWDGVVSYKYVKGQIYPTYGGEGKSTIWGYTGGDPKQPVTGETPPTDMSNVKPPTEIPNPDYDPGKPGDSETITPGYLEADKMTPGDVAGKNPMITNIGEMNEWVAAQVSFVYGENADKDKVGKLITGDDFDAIKAVIDVAWTSTGLTSDEITGNEKKWYYDGTTFSKDDYKNQMVFYYDKSLAAETQDKTAAIFESIALDEEATTEAVKKLEKMGGFAIYIQGFAVQESEFSDGSTWCKSKDIANFGNSPSATEKVTVDNPGIFGAPDKIS